MKQILFFACFLLLISFAFAQTDSTKALAVGDKAPDFSLEYATKDSVASDDISLSSLVGKRNIVLAFYPADWSGGCTKEVCSLRDNFTLLSNLDAEILAISGDSPYTHKEWANHHGLPFKLLSDHKHSVSKTYASFNDESGYNKRTVYVINKQVNIAYMDMRYSVRDSVSFCHLQDALKQLQ